jgi:hypothetical protein
MIMDRILLVLIFPVNGLPYSAASQEPRHVRASSLLDNHDPRLEPSSRAAEIGR